MSYNGVTYYDQKYSHIQVHIHAALTGLGVIMTPWCMPFQFPLDSMTMIFVI